MRIVFITNNYTPYSGGVVSSINASATALRKAGHEVFIITLDFLGAAHDDPEYVLRIPCLLKFTYNKNYFAIPWRPYHHMMRMIEDLQPDILHTHHPFYLGTTALRIAKKLSISIVFTYHTIYEGYTHYVPIPSWLARYMVTKKVLASCRVMQGIIAPSNFIQQHLQSHGIQTPTVVIPSGLQELFISHTHTLQEHKAEQVFQLLYVGRFTKEKNIPFILDVMRLLKQYYPVRADPELVEGIEANGAYPSTSSGRTAYNNYPEFQLTLVGYGVEYDNLRAYAYQTLGLSERIVQFIHKPSKQELLNYYQQADLFLFPSFLDTQGLVLAESMACGTPVVAVHGPGQRDIIQNGYNGFLVEDRSDMVAKIMEISQHQQLHIQLQRGAFETSKKYDPKHIGQSLINFYRDVLGNV